MDVTIRPLEESEADQVGVAMDRHSKRIRERLAMQAAGQGVYFIAWDNQRPVGQGLLLWYRNPSGPPELRHIPIIEDLLVVPKLRSHGIGGQIIAAAEHSVRTRGGTVVGLAVNVDNHRARALYAKLGYHDAGIGVHEQPYSFHDSQGKLIWGTEMVIDLVKDLTIPESAS